ncbi:MAG TPA: type IV toxin-antitoxin system AbiEi family antitoxin domain-containing protein [Humibacter sp.]|nr:type IV toxin-antitoxin system AbiEi family antitoxin domain-containing protein [Humibacter sp.]
MLLNDYLRSRDGIVRRVELRDRGLTSYRINALIEAGELIPVGRNRVAHPQCPAPVIAAAQAGARLGCISAAALRGLWVPDDDRRLHFAVSHGYSRRAPSEDSAPVLHRSHVPVPTGAGQTVDVLPNVLVHVARCQRLEYAVALFDSALNQRRLELEELRGMAAKQSRRFQRVVALCDGRADAGNESVLRVRLGQIGIVMVPQVVIDGHPVDGLIGERLVIQSDGFGPHSDPVRRARDLRQDNRMRLRGYEVQRFSAVQVLHRWDYVESMIVGAMAQGLHLAPRRRG